MEAQLKFNLDEAFDLVYSQLLEDRARDELNELVDDINTGTSDMLEALDLLEATENFRNHYKGTLFRPP